MDRYVIESMFGQGTFGKHIVQQESVRSARKCTVSRASPSVSASAAAILCFALLHSGRLYKARLRSDLPPSSLPSWVLDEHRRRVALESARQRAAEAALTQQQQPHSGAVDASLAASYGWSGPSSPAVGSSLSIASIRDEVVVIKEVPFQGLPPVEQQDILNEVRVMSAVHHPAFIAYYESFLDNGCLYIVMELAEGGDLAQLILNTKPKSETTQKAPMRAQGRKAIHSVDRH